MRDASVQTSRKTTGAAAYRRVAANDSLGNILLGIRYALWDVVVARNHNELHPPIDVRDEGTRVVVEVDVPGVDQNDVRVELCDAVLTIRGDRRRDSPLTAENYYVAERSHGPFERSLRLPDGLDETRMLATIENGVLHIVVPRHDDEASS